MTDAIEERAIEYADFICERFGVAQTIRMSAIVRGGEKTASRFNSGRI
jgi:hypothetical protein